MLKFRKVHLERREAIFLCCILHFLDDCFVYKCPELISCFLLISGPAITTSSDCSSNANERFHVPEGCTLEFLPFCVYNLTTAGGF